MLLIKVEITIHHVERNGGSALRRSGVIGFEVV